MNNQRTIQGEVFSNRASLSRRCVAIKQTLESTGIITDTDESFIFEVLSHHPNWAIKSLCDEPVLSIDKARYGTTCWYLTCEGQEPQSISIGEAIKGVFNKYTSTSDTLYDFKQSARSAVEDQIKTFRASLVEANEMTCAISGVSLSPSEIHIDHQPPRYFDTLLFEYTQANSINPMREGITVHSGGRISFTKQSTREGWSQYHKQEASLRAISKQANLKLQNPINPWDEYLNQLTEKSNGKETIN